ncbi:hypothetical protein GQ44DRAFT_709998 [Phaeosphaeriaceae sp. PMI808]|nr:hypothetical protein GQ44DRAFT_709998 [Phaeosphaeriaceae sp. PMI808]
MEDKGRAVLSIALPLGGRGFVSASLDSTVRLWASHAGNNPSLHVPPGRQAHSFCSFLPPSHQVQKYVVPRFRK